MDEIKRISHDELTEIVAIHGFDPDLVAKDYYITSILYLIKEVEGIYFKGGTALQKIFLNYSRLSEDIDFTVTGDVQAITREIISILEASTLFGEITKDKDVEGFTRLEVHYRGVGNEKGAVFVDLNRRAKLLMNPEKHEIRHFYNGFIPEFSFSTLAKEEIVAEKVAAAIGRNMPRDHFDIYRIIKAKLPVNLELVRKKCSDANVEFNIIRMFDKAQKLKTRWDSDLVPLLAEEVSFKEVIAALARHFNLKEEKNRQKLYTIL